MFGFALCVDSSTIWTMWNMCKSSTFFKNLEVLNIMANPCASFIISDQFLITAVWYTISHWYAIALSEERKKSALPRQWIIIPTSGHIFLQHNSANINSCCFHMSNNDAFYTHFVGNCYGFQVYAPKWTWTMLHCFYGFFHKHLAPSVATLGFWSTGFWSCSKPMNSSFLSGTNLNKTKIFIIIMREFTCHAIWNCEYTNKSFT